jgi:hypothetical protein
MVSAVKQSSVILECLAMGAKGYVEKPLRLMDEGFRAEFVQIIGRALAGEPS